MRKSTMSVAAALAASLFVWGCNEKATTVAAKQEAPSTPSPTAQMPAQMPAQTPDPAPPAPPAGSSHEGTVVETMDSGGYTYVEVDTGTQKIWAATPQFAVKVGDNVTVPAAAMPMRDYYSKTLDRTFDVVYFAPAITPAGASAPQAQSGQVPSGHPGGPVPAASAQVDLSGIPKAEGGSTVGELLADPAGFSGKEVAVRGKVVKFNAGIMGKNWIHVQDGTGGPEANDLTVTTAAVASVGDTVLVRGVAATDRDFGYGYKYAFIIEDAAVSVE